MPAGPFFLSLHFWNGKKYLFARMKNAIWSGKLIAIWGGKFNQINLWTCNFWIGQCVKQIKLNLPLQTQNVFQIKYFAIYTCAIIEEMPSADDESPISHAQFPLGKFQNHLEREREEFSQWMVEIKDIARPLSLSVRNKLTYKKVFTINLHQIYSST